MRFPDISALMANHSTYLQSVQKRLRPYSLVASHGNLQAALRGGILSKTRETGECTIAGL